MRAEAVSSLGSYGHLPFPDSSLSGSRKKMYSCRAEAASAPSGAVGSDQSLPRGAHPEPQGSRP